MTNRLTDHTQNRPTNACQLCELANAEISFILKTSTMINFTFSSSQTTNRRIVIKTELEILKQKSTKLYAI